MKLSDNLDLKNDAYFNPLFAKGAADNELTSYNVDYARFMSLGNSCATASQAFAVGQGLYEKDSDGTLVQAETIKSYNFDASTLLTQNGDANISGIPLTSAVSFTASAPIADFSRPARVQKVISIESEGNCVRHVHVLSEDRDLDKPDEKPTHLLSFKADGSSSLFSWPNKKTSGVSHLNGDTFIGVDVFDGIFSIQTVP